MLSARSQRSANWRLVDAVSGGSEWRPALERGRDLEQRAGPVPIAVSATFTLAVVFSWTDELAEVA